MIKKTVLLTLIFIIQCHSQTNEYDQLAEQINQAWTNRNYNQIEIILDNRIGSNPTDLFALSLKPFGHLYTTNFNAEAARAAADQYQRVVNSTSNSMAMGFAQTIRDLFYENNDIDSTPHETSNDLNVAHTQFPDKFPGIDWLKGYAIRIRTLIENEE